ncbi:MAG: glycosyltransferase family 4 protein [Acidimicrobiales bacterium]
MSELRVLHLLPDLATGGGQVIVHNLVTAPAEGVHHVVAALGGGPMEAAFDAAGVTVVRCDARGPFGPVRAGLALSRLVRGEGCEVIHTNNTPRDRIVGLVVAALTGRPLVNTLMAVATSHQPRRPGEPVARFARRRLGNLVNRLLARLGPLRITALSDTVRRSHAAALRLPPERIEVIPPGIPTGAVPDQAALEALRDELGLHGAYPVLISVGRLEENKGQRDLVEVLGALATRFEHVRLLLAGDGPDHERLAAGFEAAGLGDRALLLGRRADMAELYEVSDIMVSTARLEGFGMAALEALAGGCAVAGYVNEHVALGEFVADGDTGRLVPVDPPSLARAIAELAADPADLDRRTRRCREAAAAHSAERSAATMVELYRTITADPGRARRRRLPTVPVGPLRGAR